MTDDLLKSEAPGRLLSDVEYDFGAVSLPIGLPDMERACILRKNRDDLVVVAARPSVGKSAWLCQVAYNVSKSAPVDLFSLEMSAGTVKGRMMAHEANMSLSALSRLANGRLKQVEDAFCRSQLTIDDTNGLDINRLYSRAVARHRATPLAMVCVDYLQIIGTPVGRNKHEEIEKVCRRLKELAKELGIPVVVASQLNRNIEGRISQADSRKRHEITPILSDLADSSGVERWADVVVALHPDYSRGFKDMNRITAHIIKNRHGESGEFPLLYSGSVLRFYEEGGL